MTVAANASLFSIALPQLVPGTGIEPVRLFRARDFKSLVSTNFTIRARRVGNNP